MGKLRQEGNEVKTALVRFKQRCELLQEELSEKQNLQEALEAVRHWMRADLAGTVVVGKGGKCGILHSVGRPIRARFVTLKDWLGSLKDDERDKFWKAAGQSQQAGTWLECERREEADGGPKRFWVILFRLEITEYTFPKDLRCVVCLVYEDFGELFVREMTRLQVSVASAIVNCWFFQQDPKGMLEPLDRGDEVRLRRWAKHIDWMAEKLGANWVTQLPWEAEWLTSMLKDYCASRWRAKGGEAESMGKTYVALLDKTERSARDNDRAKEARLVATLMYWAWWAGARKGEISRRLDRARRVPRNEAEQLMRKMWDRAAEYGENLREVLEWQFEEMTQR